MNSNKNNYIYVSYDNRVDNITMPTMDNLLERYVDYLDVTAKSVETYTRALKQFSLYLKAQGVTQPERQDIVAFKEKLILFWLLVALFHVLFFIGIIKRCLCTLLLLFPWSCISCA